MCLELSNSPITNLSLQEEIARLETKTKPCDDLKKRLIDSPEDDEEFERDWAEFVKKINDRHKKEVRMDGPDGFCIIDQPSENKKSKLQGIAEEDDWRPPHLCKEGSTPMRGTRGLMWIICKVCGKELEKYGN